MHAAASLSSNVKICSSKACGSATAASSEPKVAAAQSASAAQRVLARRPAGSAAKRAPVRCRSMKRARRALRAPGRGRDGAAARRRSAERVARRPRATLRRSIATPALGEKLASRCFMRASSPSAGATVRPISRRAVRPQHAPRLGEHAAPAAHAAEHLDQQHGVERGVAERQALAVGLHERAARAARARELAQHAEREVDADIVVARRDERPADAAGAGAEVEQARRGDAGSRRARRRGSPAAPPPAARGGGRTRCAAAASIGRARRISLAALLAARSAGASSACRPRAGAPSPQSRALQSNDAFSSRPQRWSASVGALSSTIAIMPRSSCARM